MVDRIERHDILNAVMLAAVLLLLGFGILTAADSFASTVDEGLIEATKDEDATTDPPPAGATSSAVVENEADEVEEAATTLPETRPPAEVIVRVANGARRKGVAGAGTEAVVAAGYQTLPPKNGPTTETSIVYYANGYAAEAATVAELLGLELTAIEAMPSDPGVPIEGAHLIALLGISSDF